MPFDARCLILLSTLCVPFFCKEKPLQKYTFRLWMSGQEVGSSEEVLANTRDGQEFTSSEKVKLDRLGTVMTQEVRQSVRKCLDGRLEFTWYVKAADFPMEGRAVWHPQEPRKILITPKGMPESCLDLKEGTLLWPLDAEKTLKSAARLKQPVRIRGFSPALQKDTEMVLTPVGLDPIPGFQDAVKFKGKVQQGAMAMEVEQWISPHHGEIKSVTDFGGIHMLRQKAGLPAPIATGGPKFFERTLKPLPSHPFLPWIEEATLKWEGKGEQKLPEDGQQTRLGANRYHIKKTAEPNREDSLQMPVTGNASPDLAPYLSPSPLVPFRSPAFDDALRRIKASRQASRWELAKAVNNFVFQWIQVKNFDVGFASAAEVLGSRKGDCTEHGVLAVALLRKLGVPARGVMGWVGLNGVMGFHFWVEVKLNQRWVGIDPSFNEAPASAIRLKLADTDLSDLGSMGWDTDRGQLSEGSWLPEGDWTSDLKVEKDSITTPGLVRLKMPGSLWRLKQGRLTLEQYQVEGVTHPTVQYLGGAKKLHGRGKRIGYWYSKGQLLMEVLDGRWISITGLTESAAWRILEKLEVSHA